MNIDLLGTQLHIFLDELFCDYKKSGIFDANKINDGIEILVKGAENCMELITSRRLLSDEEFYQKLLSFARISGWSEGDYYRVIELFNKQEYKGVTTIKTRMTEVYQMTEGHGKEFSYWDEKRAINYEVLYTQDFESLKNSNHIYSKDEIQQLIDEKKIFILESSDRSIEYTDSFEQEKYYAFEEAYNHYDKNYLFFNPNGKYYLYTLKYIRMNIRKRELQKMLERHLQHSYSEINRIISKDEFYVHIDGELHIPNMYKKEYEKKDFAKRLSKIKTN